MRHAGWAPGFVHMSTARQSLDQWLAADHENGPAGGMALAGGMAYVGLIAGVPLLLAQLGGDAEEIFADAGVDLSLCEHRHNQISALAVERLLLLCAERTMCPHFGLLVGQLANLASLGPLGTLMRVSRRVMLFVCSKNICKFGRVGGLSSWRSTTASQSSGTVHTIRRERARAWSARVCWSRRRR
jgi:hypothetical protein